MYHCGYHSEASFGATSYFIVRPGGNILVDRCNSKICSTHLGLCQVISFVEQSFNWAWWFLKVPSLDLMTLMHLLKLEMLQSSIFCAIGKTDGGHGWHSLYVSYTQVWLLNPFVNSLNCWFKLYLAQLLVCLWTHKHCRLTAGHILSNCKGIHAT